MTTAILDAPPAARPDFIRPVGADDRLLRLDRLPAHRRRLICHWQRGADGLLRSLWEPEIVFPPHR